jgi:hypothetical protein
MTETNIADLTTDPNVLVALKKDRRRALRTQMLSCVIGAVLIGVATQYVADKIADRQLEQD